jgi:DNA-directed RNA polymerase specialized sigma24 family protein
MQPDQLIVQAQNGCKNSKDNLFNIYNPYIMSIARKFGKLDSDVEEMYQIGCLGFCLSLNTFKSGSFYHHMLIKIRNLFETHRKKSNFMLGRRILRSRRWIEYLDAQNVPHDLQPKIAGINPETYALARQNPTIDAFAIVEEVPFASFDIEEVEVSLSIEQALKSREQLLKICKMKIDEIHYADICKDCGVSTPTLYERLNTIGNILGKALDINKRGTFKTKTSKKVC